MVSSRGRIVSARGPPGFEKSGGPDGGPFPSSIGGVRSGLYETGISGTGGSSNGVPGKGPMAGLSGGGGGSGSPGGRGSGLNETGMFGGTGGVSDDGSGKGP